VCYVLFDAGSDKAISEFDFGRISSTVAAEGQPAVLPRNCVRIEYGPVQDRIVLRAERNSELWQGLRDLTPKNIEPGGGARQLDKGVNQDCDSWLVQGIEALSRNVGAHAMRLADPGQSEGMVCDGVVSSVPFTFSVIALHDALLRGQFAAALKICLNFRAARRHDSTAVYLQLLLPAIAELGRDWSEDRAGFAQIAFAYSLMHKIIETLGTTERLTVDPHRALSLGRVIVAVAPEDTHDFGARIMAESLRLQGWHVTFVDGTNTPKVAALLQNQPVDALALSVSTDTAFVGLADMISDWRSADRSHRMEIIVGGAAIVAPFGQYSFLQADRVGLRINELSDHLHMQITSDRHGRRNLS